MTTVTVSLCLWPHLLACLSTSAVFSRCRFPAVPRDHAGRVFAGGDLERKGHRALLPQGLPTVSSTRLQALGPMGIVGVKKSNYKYLWGYRRRACCTTIE